MHALATCGGASIIWFVIVLFRFENGCCMQLTVGFSSVWRDLQDCITSPKWNDRSPESEQEKPSNLLDSFQVREHFFCMAK